MITRHPDWQKLLKQYVTQAEARPFVRSQCDCVMFALDAVKVMTGMDMCPSARGAYSSRAGASRWIKGQGARSLEEYARRIAIQYRLEETDPMFCAVGDIAVVHSGDIGQSLAIRWISGFITKPAGKSGLSVSHDPIVCWRLGSWA